MKRRHSCRSLAGLSALALSVACGMAAAQELSLDALAPDGSQIPPTPVELGVSPPPMLLLMLDDSLSMSSNLITDDIDAQATLNMAGLNYAWTAPLPINAPGNNNSYTDAHLHRLAAPSLRVVNYWNNGAAALRVGRPVFGGVDLHPDYQNAWRAYSPQFNSQYYDPNQNYEPWPYGVDAAGTAFADATPTAVRLDPFDATAGTLNLNDRLDIDLPVIDINGNLRSAEHDRAALCLTDTDNCDFRIYIPHYYVLTDTNGDTVIDDNDTPTLIEITDADELQNFANWFQYHRSRAHSIKASLSEFMASVQDVYLGTATINGTSGGQVEAAFLNDDETSGQRRAVMDAIFSLRGTAAGTPLRKGLDDAKNYLLCNGTNLYGNTNCPRLPDPTAGSCQQAATILATDGFDTADNATVLATGFPLANGVAGSNHSVDNQPDTNARTNTDGDDDTAFDGGTYADAQDGTLGDVAMDAYERDHDAGLDARQFMSTYILDLGIPGSVAAPTTSSGSFAWPNATHGAGDFEQINLLDDLTHAAFNGRGAACSAGDPNLLDKFGSTLDLTAGRSQGTAGIGITSGAILRDQLIYLASYNTDTARGDVEAFELGLDGSLGDRVWSAADRLDVDLAGSNWEDRLVLTINQATRTGMRFAPDALCESRTDQLTELGFDNELNEALDTVATIGNTLLEVYDTVNDNPLIPGDIKTIVNAQLEPLLDDLTGLTGTNITDIRSVTRTTLCSGQIDAEFLVGLGRNLSEAIADYIRGDRSNEEQNGGDLRDRESLMGPIYRSNIAFVGAPRFDYPDTLEGSGSTQSYNNFRAAHANRREMVYVGGNDGMLHGFDANTGEELLAYVPGAIIHRVAEIADPGYTASTYVDGEISVVDAYDSFPACPSGEKCWRTILVSGLGGGGQGYFALDVTEPALFAAATTTAQQDQLAEDIVLWEFTDSPSGLGIPGLSVSSKLLVQGILTDGLYDLLGDLADPSNIDDVALNTTREVCKDLLPIDALCNVAIGPAVTLIDTVNPLVSGALSDLEDISGLTLPTLESVTTTVSEFLDDLIPTGDQFGHPDMGFTFGQPNITRMADGRWAAIVSNGYHSTDVDLRVLQDSNAQLLNLGVSTSGNAVLYIVDLATGAINQTGFAGVFDTGVGNWLPPLTTLNGSNVPTDATDPSNPNTAGDFETNNGRPNGLADPAPVDIDGDFTIDRIYAGDERGNMWRIDTTDSDSTNWDFSFKLLSENRPLANASVIANAYQPITTRPEVGMHPIEDILVLFGTGKFHEVEDLNSVNQPTQSFYSIWDNYDPGTQPDIDQDDLLEQTIEDESTVTADLDGDGTDEQATLRVTSDNPVNYRNALNTGAGTHLGWYIDFIVDGASSNEGERIFGDPALRNGQIAVATVLPSDSQCAFEGSSVVYRFESASGGRPLIAPIDQTIDGIFANGIRNDAISQVPTVLLTEDGREVTLQRSADGDINTVITSPGGFERQRATWRELR